MYGPNLAILNGIQRNQISESTAARLDAFLQRHVHHKLRYRDQREREKRKKGANHLSLRSTSLNKVGKAGAESRDNANRRTPNEKDLVAFPHNRAHCRRWANHTRSNFPIREWQPRSLSGIQSLPEHQCRPPRLACKVLRYK